MHFVWRQNSNLHTKVISRTASTGPITEAAEGPIIGVGVKEFINLFSILLQQNFGGEGE